MQVALAEENAVSAATSASPFAQNLAEQIIGHMGSQFPEVKRHCERVAEISYRLAKALGLDEAQAREAELVGGLHDLGKIIMPDEIIRKPRSLNASEHIVIKGVPSHSASIARLLGLSSKIQDGISQRHERPDGRGYPYGIAGSEINLYAKIVAVADTFDSLTHDQPYRGRCSKREAIGVIRSKSQWQFDPLVVDAFTILILGRQRAQN